MAYSEDFNPDDFPLPQWAKCRSTGDYLQPGAQLMTRDGRRCGNAYVDEIKPHDRLGHVAVVVTDIGNKLYMTPHELEETFYPPVYIMCLDEARARRGIIPK